MFKILHIDNQARSGLLKTKTCRIPTPFFMPVTTKGAAKFVDFEELKVIGIDCVISNSYLMYAKPGVELVKKVGGLHKLYAWKKGIFTDSGGFQSLDEFFLQKSNDKGAFFKSPYNGKTEMITPEKSMEIQLALDPDVAMCLDDVPVAHADAKTMEEKTARTHDWAKRCKAFHDKHTKGQLLFGIAQGGMSKKLRKESIRMISDLDFDGIALGGLAIGEPIHTMYEMLKASVQLAPADKIRYLMGVGSPVDILECVSMGVDCFDSTFPTQNARHGTLFTWQGKLKLTRSEFATDTRPVDNTCDCFVCKKYTRAYIRHLLDIGEPTGKKLATYHNLFFMQRLMETVQTHIKIGNYDEFSRKMIKIYKG